MYTESIFLYPSLYFNSLGNLGKSRTARLPLRDYNFREVHAESTSIEYGQPERVRKTLQA